MLRGVTPVALLAGALLAAGSVAARPAVAQDTVAIGLVIPGGDQDGGIAAEVRAAAEAAIADANRDGGYRGRPFALRIVNEDGLWGRGLGRVVGLAFDHPVTGVIGGLDGRSAHLIQQVVIKARIPFLTPWASDPTLSRANIPWFFQMVPDDRQQAAAIVAGAGRVVVVADTAYDDRHFAAALSAVADSAGTMFQVIEAAPGAATAAAAVAGTDGRAGDGLRVVLATGETDAVRILERLSALPRPPTVCIPLRLAAARVATAAARYPGRVLVAVVGEPADPGARLAARHTRDAVSVLVAAIRSAGLDPWRIRDALAAASVEGEAGTAFDDAGRRAGPVRLVELVGPAPAPSP